MELSRQTILLDMALLDSTEVLIDSALLLTAPRTPALSSLPDPDYLLQRLDVYNGVIDDCLHRIYEKMMFIVEEHGEPKELAPLNRTTPFCFTVAGQGQGTKCIEDMPAWAYKVNLHEWITSLSAAVKVRFARIANTSSSSTINDSEALEDDEFSVYLHDLILNVFSNYLALLRQNFISTFSSVFQADTRDHMSEVLTLLYVTSALALLFLISLYLHRKYSLHSFNTTLLSYELLRHWEYRAMIEEVTAEEKMFRDGYFHEELMMVPYAEMTAKNPCSEYMVLQEKMIGLDKNDGRRVQRVWKFNLKGKGSYPSTRRGTFVGILTFLYFICIPIMVYWFINSNNTRSGMQESYLGTFTLYIDVYSNYIAAILLCHSGFKYPVANTLIADNAFARAVDNFIVYITGKKRDYDFYYGKSLSSILSAYISDDLCPSLTDPTLHCTEHLHEGIIGVLQWEKAYIESLRGKMAAEYATELEASKTTDIRPFYEEYFSPEFVEMRLSHYAAFNSYFEHFLRISETRTRIIRDDMNYYVAGWVYVISLILGVVLVFLYIWVAASQKADLDVCYELFWLIGPMFLTNNKLLQTQLKSSYHGIG